MFHVDSGCHFCDHTVSLMDMIGGGRVHDMAMSMASGPPAMFVFLNAAVKGLMRDGLEWCYSSIFPCQLFYCSDLECQEAVNL